MKVFSWIVIVAGVLVAIGAVEDPTGEKPLHSIIAGVMTGAIILAVGLLTIKAWESRRQDIALYVLGMGGVVLAPVVLEIFGEAFLSTGAMRAFLSAREAVWWSRFLMTTSLLLWLYGIFLAAVIVFRNRVMNARAEDRPR